MTADGPNAYYRLRYHVNLINSTFFREVLISATPLDPLMYLKKLCNKRFLSDISLSPFNALSTVMAENILIKKTYMKSFTSD